MNAPLFNVDLVLWVNLLVSWGSTLANTIYYLTISDGHVIKFTSEGPEVIGRFEDDAHAKETLIKAGWREHNGRFFPEHPYEEVSQDKWSDFLIQFKCHGTEPSRETMAHLHNETGECLAVVLYKPKTVYFIKINPTSPKI